MDNYANGRRSIEALPSILIGVPSILDTPISQSKYQTNYFQSIPRFLQQLGYTSSFFHGGKTGTMDFDSFTRSIGIKNYFGKEDYDGPNEHYDGTWGIFDHHFLDFMLRTLKKEKTPFFSSIFTLSSHQPYTIPIEFQGRFSKGSLEIHESIGYVDAAIRLFFEKAKKEKWYRNTLFIITADHTQKLSAEYKRDLVDKYKVPLIFFHPTKKLMSSKKVTQHVDIAPSIMDFVSDIPKKKMYFGSSVFNNDIGLAFNYNNILLYAKDKYVLQSNFDSSSIYESNVRIEDEVIQNQMLEEGKALYQYGVNGLILNSLNQ